VGARKCTSADVAIYGGGRPPVGARKYRGMHKPLDATKITGRFDSLHSDHYTQAVSTKDAAPPAGWCKRCSTKPASTT
jgi:hypothetical protein